MFLKGNFLLYVVQQLSMFTREISSRDIKTQYKPINPIVVISSVVDIGLSTNF